MSGRLVLVGTPIGNLEDVTPRARAALAEADIVVAEDTRRTRALLTHLGITGKSLVALDANATDDAVTRVAARLVDGATAALVTDAGMPAVSDPGAALVGAARAAGVAVGVVPGVSAVTAAVAVSGLVDGPFFFLGFPSRRGARRREALARALAQPEPCVLFEAPHRMAETAADLADLGPDRTVCLCRELTKVHEEIWSGTARELAARAEWRGEVTLVIAGNELDEPTVTDADLDARIDERLAAGAPVKSIAAEVAAWSGRPRRDMYGRVQARRDRRDDG